jgi:hypothetical protein
MSPPAIVLSYPAVDPDALVDHVGFLQECGYAFVGAGQLVDRWPADGEPEPGLAAICLEGSAHDEIVTAAPLLAVLGVPATHFIDPSLLGARGGLLSEDDAADLAAGGAELGVVANGVPLGDARVAIERLSGRRCRLLAWPEEQAAAPSPVAARRAGFDAAFVPAPGAWQRFAAPRLRMPVRDGLGALGRWMERYSGRMRAAFVTIVLELDPFDMLNAVAGSL